MNKYVTTTDRRDSIYIKFIKCGDETVQEKLLSIIKKIWEEKICQRSRIAGKS